MEKSRIVFLGSRDLGYRALKWLLEDGRFIVLGVSFALDLSDRFSEKRLLSLVEEYQLNVISQGEIKDIEFDIGISVNHHKVLGKSILELAPRGFWNIHHSYNLRLKGRNITTHAILNAKAEHIQYHGTSLHLMVPELDSGGIAASSSVKIEEEDTAYSLFMKVDDAAFELFKEWIPRIAFEKVYPYEPPNEGIMIFKDKDLPSKEVPNNLLDNDKYDYVRAFDFPKYEPAYIIENGKKIELVVKERENYRKKIIFANRGMFTRVVNN